jgi:hypothetical protein
MDKQVVKFDGRREFEQQLRLCLARAEHSLQLFDPDFSMWVLGASDVEAALRTFLLAKGRLQLVAHSNTYLERDCPRFLRLLHDFSHQIECRLTPKNLRQLSDSFCIADQRHIVRRFHSDHLRGEAVFDGPADTELSSERFATIWIESVAGLHVSTTGL